MNFQHCITIYRIYVAAYPGMCARTRNTLSIQSLQGGRTVPHYPCDAVPVHRWM